MPSLKQWGKILSKEAYAQAERLYQARDKNTGAIAKHEQDICHEPLATKEAPRFNSKVSIRVHSVRNRLIDHDNLFSKYFIDAIRYCGILLDDSPQHIQEIRHTQEKGKDEYTVITIEAV